jgi:nitrite reductase/ring-hydroxylating ferredoxin subunit
MEKPHTTYIVDDQTAGLFRVNRRAFTDPECLEEERARLFGRCWIYVGHESEVPHAGDYISRSVAGRSMIMVRSDDNIIRVLLNTCTHRGAQVCRQRSGNARTFQCPYHAWTFNSRGQHWSGCPVKNRIAKRSLATSCDWPRLRRSIAIAASSSPVSIPRLTISTTIWPAHENISTWSPTSRKSE